LYGSVEKLREAGGMHRPELDGNDRKQIEHAGSYCIIQGPGSVNPYSYPCRHVQASDLWCRGWRDVTMLCRHHLLHASSTPLLASSGCVNASVTAPVCPRLNVSFFFYCFAFAHSCFVVPSCRVPSLMLRPLPHAASALSCCVHSLMPRLHPHPRCINPPSPGLSRLHQRPDLCAPCRMPWC
jgi:hypothetical protein